MIWFPASSAPKLNLCDVPPPLAFESCDCRSANDRRCSNNKQWSCTIERCCLHFPPPGCSPPPHPCTLLCAPLHHSGHEHSCSSHSPVTIDIACLFLSIFFVRCFHCVVNTPVEIDFCCRLPLSRVAAASKSFSNPFVHASKLHVNLKCLTHCDTPGFISGYFLINDLLFSKQLKTPFMNGLFLPLFGLFGVFRQVRPNLHAAHPPNRDTVCFLPGTVPLRRPPPPVRLTLDVRTQLDRPTRHPLLDHLSLLKHFFLADRIVLSWRTSQTRRNACSSP